VPRSAGRRWKLTLNRARCQGRHHLMIKLKPGHASRGVGRALTRQKRDRGRLRCKRGVRKGAAFVFGWLVPLAIVVTITVLATGNSPPSRTRSPPWRRGR
jgi:hypothetical protein